MTCLLQVAEAPEPLNNKVKAIHEFSQPGLLIVDNNDSLFDKNGWNASGFHSFYMFNFYQFHWQRLNILVT